MRHSFIVQSLVDFFKFDFLFNGLKKYAHLGGCEKRKDFFLFQISCVLILFGFDVMSQRLNYPSLVFLYCFFIFTPVISSMVRRLHDTGHGGRVLPISILLASVVFFVGSVLFYGKSNVALAGVNITSLFIILYPFVLFFMPSKVEDNKYIEKPSHPVKHGIVMVSFLIVFVFFLYVFGMILQHVNVLPEEDALTSEEIMEIDSLIKTHQSSK